MINFFIAIITRYAVGLFYVNLARATHGILIAISLPIVLQVISLDDYGLLQLSLALESWFAIMAGSKILQASKRGIALGLEGTSLFALIAYVKRALPLMGVCILGSYIFESFELHSFAILSILIGIHLLLGHPAEVLFYEYLVAKKQFRVWGLLHSIDSLIIIVLTASIAVVFRDFIVYSIFFIATPILLHAGRLLWFMYSKKIFLSYRRKEIDEQCLTFGLHYRLIDILNATMNTLPYVIISSLFGLSSLGIFSIAKRMRDSTAESIKAIRNIIYSEYTHRTLEKILYMLYMHLSKLFMSGIGICLVAASVAYLYTVMFLSPDLRISYTFFIILLIGVPFTPALIIFHTALDAHFQYRQLLFVNALSTVITLMSIIALTYFFELNGIVAAVALQPVAQFFSYLLFLNRRFLKIGEHASVR